MIRRSVCAIAVLTLLGAAATQAKSTWEAKPFHEWTVEEMKELTTTSPWAGAATIKKNVKTVAPEEVIESVHVTWTTALPVRQAVVREYMGTSKQVTKDMETFLSQEGEIYAISLKVSGPGAAALARSAGTSQMSTSLQREDEDLEIRPWRVEGQLLDKDGRLIVPAADGSIPREAAGALLVYAFPRKAALTAKDKSVVFETTVGNYTIRKRFDLGDMVYNGELAL